MKTWIKFALLGAGIALSIIPLHATTVTGTFKYNGTPFTGYLTYQLTYPSSTGTYIDLPISSAPIYVSNGQLASLSLDGNDILLPRGTSYSFTLYDMYSTPITRLNYVITGSTFDLGQAVPTPVLTQNVSFLDLLGIRNFSALNATFTSQIQIGSGTIMAAAGISNAETIGGIAFAQAYATQAGSTTCGIQEALNALPSTGGIVVLQPGSCNLSASAIITKPVVVMGFGSGGYADSSTFTTFTSGTLLTQTTSGAIFFVTPAAATTLSGVHFRGMALTGTISGALLSLGNSSSSTAFLRDVELDDVLIYKAAGYGVDTIGNLEGLYIHNSAFNNNVGAGIEFNPSASFAVSDVSIGPSVYAAFNASALSIDSSACNLFLVRDAHFTHNTQYGINVASISTSASVRVTQSDISYNGTSGLNLAGGYGHTLDGSNLTSGGAQQFGVNLTSSAGPGFQTLSFSDNNFGNNTTADVSIGAAVSNVTVYPQISQSAATYAVNTWSISAGTATLNVTNNLTISASSPITVSSAVGSVGCTNFNGPHTAATASTTVITFPTTCTGSGSNALVSSGSMTIAASVPSVVHYVSFQATSYDYYFSVTACSVPASTDGACTGNITIPPADFLPDASYIPALSVSNLGGAQQLGISINGSLSTSTIPYIAYCTFGCGSSITPTIYVHVHHN